MHDSEGIGTNTMTKSQTKVCQNCHQEFRIEPDPQHPSTRMERGSMPHYAKGDPRAIYCNECYSKVVA